MSDHKEEALRLIQIAGDIGSDSAATAAVAHATLALAEQQRIANLFQSLDLLFPDEIQSDKSIDLQRREARTRATVATIREGLGL